MAAIAEIVCWWLATAGVWLLTLSSVAGPELAAAAAAGLLCGLAAWGARRALGDAWRPRARWALWLGPLSLAVAADCVRVLALAARLAFRRGEPGRLAEVRLPGGEPDAVAGARRALATLTLSATPGTFVVDSDPEENTMVIHSLVGGGPRLERTVSR